jgi:general secretion pathway protein L
MQAMKSGGEDTLAFLRLSQILFSGVEQIEGLSVDQLRYQDTNNELQLRLIYPSFESAGQLETAIRAAGGQLITGGVREQSGQFVGEATLRGGAS